MQFTDLFIKRPVLATVISLMILALGLRSLGALNVRQFPFTMNAVITVTTVYTGASPEVISGFITTPLEHSIAQANGIDYMTSQSLQNVSVITVNLKLNYDPNYALADVSAKINAVLNKLPKESQMPSISISIGQTIDAMYLGFYSDVLENNQISDYLKRVVQPRFQAIDGIQVAEILGEREFAMRAWMYPDKLSGFGVTAADIGTALADNDFITSVGRTDGQMFTENLTVNTGLTNVKEFKDLIVKAQNNTILRLSDVAHVAMGATNYDNLVKFSDKPAVYIGIQVAPAANLLTVVDNVRKTFPSIQQQLPKGLAASIVYDSSEFVNSAIHEVINSLLEALIIVTVVIYLFLGTIRSVLIPVIAIPLSLVGALFIMFILGYSINLLTLLALVLAIGLVVDDAIIVVENVQRHMEEGTTRLDSAIMGARELAGPIIAISIVLIAVYVPIGFMGGLTGALFTEFSFTLAGAVAVSAVIALTLSPMMCSKFLKLTRGEDKNQLIRYLDMQFDRLRRKYEYLLHDSLNYLPVTIVFSTIIIISIYFLFITASSELAPKEDQGVILAQLTAAPNATLQQTELYSNEVSRIFERFPETERVFQIDGANGLNTSFLGMGLKPWDKRTRTTKTLQPLLQDELNKVSGARIAAFQLPPLPGSRGLPIQYVICSSETFDKLNDILESIMAKARESGMFVFLDTDLKIDKAQTNIVLDRDKSSLFGLTMKDFGDILSNAMSQNYINWFNYAGRSYQVIPQIVRDERINTEQLLNYYFNTKEGLTIPLKTVATLQQLVVPETLNHFQQLNSATIIGVAYPGVTMGTALNVLKDIATPILPQGYLVEYAGESRQYVQESTALITTFFFALVIIFLSLAALFESFKDPLIILISVPMSICGALIFISMGIGGASLNIYTEVGLVTLIGLISKHGILIVQFANDLQLEGKGKREAIQLAAGIRLRPILMTTAAMVMGVIPLIFATGAGAVSRYNIGLVIATGISIGTLFTLFVVPAVYLLLATEHTALEKDMNPVLNENE